jgi:hypothetical protein
VQIRKEKRTMNTNIENLLDDEIVEEFKCLKGIDVGTEPYKTAVEGIVKLMDRSAEIAKVNIEREEKARQTERDENFKKLQMVHEERDRLIKNCIAVAGIIIPSVITVWGTIKSIKFEETGTITTIMGRGFINKLLPKK